MIAKRFINAQCSHMGNTFYGCTRQAVWGLYGSTSGQTDVNLNRPLAVYCGQHKPRLSLLKNFRTRNLRNVKLLTGG